MVSLVGFGFNLISISWLVLEKTSSEYELGKILAMATMPGLFLAFFAGVIIDKVNRKWLLIVLDIFRMFVLFIFLYFTTTNGFEIWTIYPVSILMGIGNSLFWPTAQAFVQEIVSDNEYFNANKLLSASYQFGSIIGAGLGGFIVHLYDPIVALWINSLTYLISAILISFAPFQYSPNNHKKEDLFSALQQGLIFLRNRFDILILGVTTILSDVAIWGSLSVLTISISKEIFNKGSWGYGLLDGLYGIGALISTVLVGLMIEKASRKNVLIICYSIAGFMCFFVPFLPTIYLASIAYFFMGLNNNSARIIVRTIFMENIPNQIMGRVQTIFGIYSRAMVVFSTLLAGWIIENMSIPTAVNFTVFHYFFAMIGTVSVAAIWNTKSSILLVKN
jgi:MFS family permease